MQPMATPRSSRYRDPLASPTPSHHGTAAATPRNAGRMSMAMEVMSSPSGEAPPANNGANGANPPGTKENIHTVVRIRPDIDGHQGGSSATKCVWADADGKHINIGFEGREVKRFKFDHVFGQNAQQSDMFGIAKRFVDACMKGYNGTIFAYGSASVCEGQLARVQPTAERVLTLSSLIFCVGVPFSNSAVKPALGQSKTYTMMGVESSRGLIPQLLQAIFARVNERVDNEPGVNIDVAVESLEIYNENIRDLLSDRPGSASLDIKNHPQIHVPGLTRTSVSTYGAAIRLMEAGSRARTVGATKMNDQSSRSHSVFTLNITTSYAENNTKSTSRLNLVDLAGSESQKSAGTAGDRLKEAANINKSLSALVGYISWLSTQKNFVSSRNSKLTHLLSDSIGGNSKTTLIATINPSSDVYSDSLNTLNFAATAKEIKSDAKQNVMVNGRSVDPIALQKKYDSLTKEVADLKVRHAGHGGEVAELRQEKHELNLRLLSTLDQNIMNALAADQYHQSVIDSDALKRETLEECLEWNEELEANNRDLQLMVEEKERQLADLTSMSSSSVRASAMQIGDLRQQIQDMAAEHEATRASLAATEAARSELEEQVRNLSARMGHLKSAWAERDSQWTQESAKASKAFDESSGLVLAFSAALRAERAELTVLQQRVARGENVRRERDAIEREQTRSAAQQVRELEESHAAQAPAQLSWSADDSEVTEFEVSAEDLESRWLAFDQQESNTMRTFLDSMSLRTSSSPARHSHSHSTPPSRAAGLYQRTPLQPSSQQRRSGSEKLWENVIKPVLAQYDPATDADRPLSICIDENMIGSASKHKQRHSPSVSRHTPRTASRHSLAAMR